MKNYILIGLLCCLLLASCGNNSKTQNQSTPTPTLKVSTSSSAAPTPVQLNLYGSEIVKEELDNLNRVDLWVTVPNSDTLTEDNIKDCMTNIIKNYTSSHKVTAVTLFLADTVEDVNKSSYTLGRCMYYPKGDISNALNTTPGDYTTFTYNYDINSREDKHKPTDLEIEIYDYVNSELEQNSDEDAVNQKAAEKYNISVDELNQIWVKVYTYKH